MAHEYDEAMIKEAFDDTQYGVMVRGEAINPIRYADDNG